MQYWFYETSIGTFYIFPKDGRFCIVFNDEILGSFLRPWQASEDLARGEIHTISNPKGGTITDLSKFGIPADIHEWQTAVK